LSDTFLPRAVNAEDARRRRRFETRDIVRRVGVLSPKRVYINNYPVGNPIAIFNPSVRVEGKEIILYARVIIGYYKYVSAIAEVRLFYEDIETGDVNINYYAGKIVVYPSTRYDVWGTEDPRVYIIDNEVYMTYTGRTSFYFTGPRRERTLPVTAVLKDGAWRKILVAIMPDSIRPQVVTDKNAFFTRLGDDLLFFHRIHMSTEEFYLAVSKVDREEFMKAYGRGLEEGKPQEVTLSDTTVVMDPAPFEKKLGWATPPLIVGSRKLIAFIHSVDREVEAYRLTAILLEYDREEGIVVKG